MVFGEFCSCGWVCVLGVGWFPCMLVFGSLRCVAGLRCLVGLVVCWWLIARVVVGCCFGWFGVWVIFWLVCFAWRSVG